MRQRNFRKSHLSPKGIITHRSQYGLMPGYNQDWADMSSYLVHFTKDIRNKTAYHNMMGIWGDQELKAMNPYGVGRNTAPSSSSQKVVCFSEVPLHLIQRISERRSRYGIGFTKEFITNKGGAPVWYLEENSRQANCLGRILRDVNNNRQDELSDIWELTPFIDIAGDHSSGSYRFEWEREWRILGNLRFEESEVSFLIIPEEDHWKARDFFEHAIEENIGPGYLCPYIDSAWSQNQIREVLDEN